MRGASLDITWSDFEFGSSANCKKVGPKPSAQRIMNRISSNKNAHKELESFLLDLDSSEGMEGSGKGGRNVIVFNCKEVGQ